jgi:hypothetical protein
LPSDTIQALSAAIVWLSAMGCTAQSGEFDMQQTADSTDVFYEFSADRPAKIDIQPKQIQTGEVPRLPRAEPTDKTDIVAQYSDHSRSSRCPNKLADSATWQIRWRTELPTALQPQYLMHSANRTVLAGANQWCLIDERGQKIGNLMLRASGVSIDPENGLFYAADRYGYVVGRRLADAVEALGVYGHFGPDFARNQIIRNGSQLLIVSVQLPPDPFAGRDAELSMAEVHDLGDPITLDKDKVVISDKITRNLIRKTTQLISAYENGTLVLGVKDRLYVADSNLKISAALAGKFVPIWLSLDTQRNIYAIVHEGDKLALWGVTLAGVRFLSVQLPSEFDRMLAPPIIGYDNRVYIVAPDQVIAVESPGRVVWQRPLGGAAGAVVAADDQLLVSDGARVLAFDRDGKGRVLFSVGNDMLLTAPILTAPGDLMVASSMWLYRIAPKLQ